MWKTVLLTWIVGEYVSMYER